MEEDICHSLTREILKTNDKDRSYLGADDEDEEEVVRTMLRVIRIPTPLKTLL